MQKISLMFLTSFLTIQQLAAAAPSLEERYSQELCLGRWKVNESLSISTRTRVEIYKNIPYPGTKTEELPPLSFETRRFRYKEGPPYQFRVDCRAHADAFIAANPAYYAYDIDPTDHVIKSHRAGGTLTPRTEYSAQGVCKGKVYKKILVDAYKWMPDSDNTTESSETKITFSKIGLKKSSILQNPQELITESLVQKAGRQEPFEQVDSRRVYRTIDTRYNTPFFPECSSADHIPAGNYQQKAEYLLQQVDVFERANRGNCADPEFWAIQGTLAHLRLRDVNGMMMGSDVRRKIDEKLVKYPSCLLSGDTLPSSGGFDGEDFEVEQPSNPASPVLEQSQLSLQQKMTELFQAYGETTRRMRTGIPSTSFSMKGEPLELVYSLRLQFAEREIKIRPDGSLVSLWSRGTPQEARIDSELGQKILQDLKNAIDSSQRGELDAEGQKALEDYTAVIRQLEAMSRL